MQRELKFRAWYDLTKVMYAFDLMDGNFGHGDGYIGMYPINEDKSKPGKWRGNTIQVDPYHCEIMQFTGLKDTDGTDCYFDDIIKFPDDSIGVLVWFGDCLGVASGTINNYHATDQIRSYELSDCRVIGNIHEHPELLNG